MGGHAKIELPRAAGKLCLRIMISVCVADSFRCGEDERSTYYEKSCVLLDELHLLTTLCIAGELRLFHAVMQALPSLGGSRGETS